MTLSTVGVSRAIFTAQAKKKPPFRADIQGLRALAVLLVISDHLFGFPGGGFIGVDVFFVISGFLITGLLVREHQRWGRISFADFYRRRARRIIPLSVLVLAATVSASWLIFSGSRAWKITEDGLWSLVFGTNWRLAVTGTDYMQADGVVSPLQHYWSLAVEEQFYVAWPWLLIAVLGVVAVRQGWSTALATVWLAVAIGLLSAVSFAFSLWETSASPTFAYFSTFSRAWELGVGGLVAVLSTLIAKIPERARPVLAYIGLLGIVYGAFSITSDMQFPGPWAVVPVLSTALVIAAGSGGRQRYLGVLTNPVSRYLGDISFSLYLWHFPIMVLFAAVVPIESPVHFITVLFATLGISSLSYHFFEDPMRKSAWLEPGGNRNRGQQPESRRLIYGALIGLAMVTLVVTSMAVVRTLPVDQGLATSVGVPMAKPTASQAVTAASTHQSEIVSALITPAWPDLQPSIDKLGHAAKVHEWIDDGCLSGEAKSLSDPIENSRRCVYGDLAASKTAVVLGDSIAISYVPAIRASLEPQGFKVYVLTLQQCPWVSVSVLQGSKAPHAQCDPFRTWAFSEVQRLKPDLVLLSGNYSVFPASNSRGSDQELEWMEGSKTSFQRLSDASKIVVLDPPPSGKALDACVTRVSTPVDCESRAEGLYEVMRRANRAAAEAMVGAVDVQFFNTKEWFCTPDGRCPSFIGNTPVYADGFHLTTSFSASLGPLFTEALETSSRP